MSNKEKIDPESRRLIERNRLSALLVISKICLITTTNEDDESELRSALQIAKYNLSEIEFYLAGDF